MSTVESKLARPLEPLTGNSVSVSTATSATDPLVAGQIAETASGTATSSALAQVRTAAALGAARSARLFQGAETGLSEHNELWSRHLKLVDSGSGKGLLSGRELRSGYLPRNEAVDQILNRGLAALLLLTTLPLFAIISAIILLSGARPIFYSGTRIGRFGVPFQILKFRTLDKSAARATSGRTLPKRTQLETSVGSYLRSSRMDELPQLINILRGEMVFFGPRPTRPEMAAQYAAEAPGNELRYLVRPGLTGLAQALMTHQTPKRVRARFNSMCCRTHINYPRMASFVFLVGLNVLIKGMLTLVTALRDAGSPVGSHRWLYSGFATPRNATVSIETESGTVAGALGGMSDEVLQFAATQPLPEGDYAVELVRKRRGGRRTRVRIKVRITSVMPMGIGLSGYAHFATYSIPSPLGRYRIERYFLDLAVIPG